MKQTVIYILFIVILSGCKKEEKSSDMIEVDMTSYQERLVFLSEFADSIEYIPLETNDSCLLSGMESVQIWGNYLLIRDYDHYYLFNRQGKFLRQISSQGRGPGQHPSFTTKNICFSSKDSCFYFNYSDNARIDRFDLNGNFKESIDYSAYQDEYKGQEIYRTAFLKDSIWVIHAANRKGDDPVRLLFFSQNGHFIHKIVNTDFWEGVNRKTLKRGASGELNVEFYYNDKHQLFFREERGDTVFEITPDMKLKPHIIFSFHDNNNYAQRRNGEAKNIIWQFIKENNHFLFFSYKYPSHLPLAYGIYDKQKKKFFRLKRGGPLYYKTQTPLMGIVDDLSGGLNLRAENPILNSIAMENSLISYQSANELLHMLTPENLSRVAYQDTLARQKLVQMLDTINENDNPILIIAYLKK